MLRTNVKVPGMLAGMYYISQIAHCMQALTLIVWQLYRYGLRWHAHNSRLELWVVLGWINEDHIGRRRTGCGTRPHTLVNRFVQLQAFSVFLATIANPAQMMAARVRAFEELPSQNECLGDAPWVVRIDQLFGIVVSGFFLVSKCHLPSLACRSGGRWLLDWHV